MKKNLFSILLAALCVASMAITASAADRTPVTVYYNTPDLDGVISDGEWDKENAIVMDASNSAAWGGEISNQITFYYAWDDEGLYAAAQVKDDDLMIPANSSEVYSKDCFQIAIDPAGLLGNAGVGGGMFYSLAVCQGETLGAVYHPYGGAAEDFEYEGAARLTSDGWEFEMMIPWTSIEILADDGYAWTHAEGETINALIACLDRNSDGTANMFKTVLSGVDATDFTPANYALELKLEKKVAPSLEAETETVAPAADADVTETVATTTAPATFDAGIVAAVAAIVSAAGYAVAKKH